MVDFAQITSQIRYETRPLESQFGDSYRVVAILDDEIVHLLPYIFADPDDATVTAGAVSKIVAAHNRLCEDLVKRSRD